MQRSQALTAPGFSSLLGSTAFLSWLRHGLQDCISALSRLSTTDSNICTREHHLVETGWRSKSLFAIFRIN